MVLVFLQREEIFPLLFPSFFRLILRLWNSVGVRGLPGSIPFVFSFFSVFSAPVYFCSKFRQTFQGLVFQTANLAYSVAQSLY